jgi:hypothetical protein
VVWCKSADILEEHIGAEDQAKQETSKQSSVPAKHGLTFTILHDIIF